MERELSPHDGSCCGRREQAGMRITSKCAAANSREKKNDKRRRRRRGVELAGFVVKTTG
jgi:hypothetical protein